LSRLACSGLLTATLATGLFLGASTPASAHPAQLVTGSTDLKRHTTTVRPPVLGKSRVTCSSEAAGTATRLRNPNKIALHYMVTLIGGDYAESYVVSPAARSVVRVEFAGVPNGRFALWVQNAAGDVVAQTRVRVRCRS
jgi:hypothetical protein